MKFNFSETHAKTCLSDECKDFHSWRNCDVWKASPTSTKAILSLICHNKRIQTKLINLNRYRLIIIISLNHCLNLIIINSIKLTHKFCSETWHYCCTICWSAVGVCFSFFTLGAMWSSRAATREAQWGNSAYSATNLSHNLSFN